MLTVYNLYDDAQEEFILQFLYVNDTVCKRNIQTLYENGAFFRQIPDAEKYPNTYRVFKTATFDEKLGVYTSLDVKTELFSFAEFIKDESSDS